MVVPVAACAVALFALRPASPVRAAQEARPPVPATAPDCGRPLPLPSQFPFAKSQYEIILGRFLRAGCYADWHHDKEVRPTGPTVAALGGSDPHVPQWITTTLGTHNTVVVYYSPDVYRWMCEQDAAHEKKFVAECRKACPDCRLKGKAPVRPIADGSMILKLMYGNTTAQRLEQPSVPKGEPHMFALMVRDSHGSKDGWYWGSWDPQATEASQLDWPPPVNLPYPWMGFGYYCVNCHASARDEFTFSSLNNVLGNPDTFLKFYFQDQPPILGEPKQPAVETLSAHERFETLQDLLSRVRSAGPTWNKVPWPNPQVNRVSQPFSSYSDDFLETFGAKAVTQPDSREITRLFMPPEVYDHVFSGADLPPLFLTSDQCVGCHAAGSTGLHYDMTLQQMAQPAYANLLNLAPYGEWRGSPMGLAGRDPIFFSQLETEQTAHPALAKLAPDLCLHCHGVMGQRQFCLDQFKGDPKKGNAVCNNTDLLGLDEDSQPIVPRQLFSREMVKAIPFLATTEQQKKDAKYGGLARDGVSCTTCHHIEIDDKEPIGNTFTGDFRVGAADAIHGPFNTPQQVPMNHSLGVNPIEYPPLVHSSKVCGSCHSVVLPVFDGDKPWVRPGAKKPEVIIEQATYPEWVFSEFRDGGSNAQSCQDCHMSTSYPGAPERPLNFKIASIQEASNMPQTENRQPQKDIDLQPRSPFGRHTLVGLNVFFNQFAQQFPDILGIRIQDPMLGGKGVAPLTTTFNSMIQQADTATARVSVTRVRTTPDQLVADVQVENLAGHKFPSGVGFRRAFLTFEVLDASGNDLWASGRATPTGVLVDANGQPIAGEFMWKSECQPKTKAEQTFQPHYETITRQDQAQIYQELIRDPRGRLTTSFLSLADVIKDNRLLPRGWTPTMELARSEGLGSAKLSVENLVRRVLPDLPDGHGGEVHDPWYEPKSQGGLGGGGDALTYAIPLADLKGAQPASVRVTLYYQAIPPSYLQDRFCSTPAQPDTARLFFVAGHANLDGTRAEGWKLQVVSSGVVGVGAPAREAASSGR
ncbi:MAG: cytochrome P460 family protein [Acidobacteria bacterium]|nr:cytochrome P460 family protein [Acidobacteriota bacterium]